MATEARAARAPAESVSFALGEIFISPVIGSWGNILGVPFKLSVPCRSLTAVIEGDYQIISRTSRGGAEERLQRSRRMYFSR